MAYNTKPLVTSSDSMPCPQYYNADTDAYEPAQGIGNALNNIGARIIYSSNGNASQTVNGFGTGTSIMFKNDGTTDITLNINNMTFVIKQSEVFDETFKPFNSLSISGNAPYRFWIRGF